MSQQLQEQILEQIKDLPDEKQRRVLDFVRAFTTPRPRGIAGKDLLGFAGTIPFDDTQLMARVIDKGCEQVDTGEW